MALGVVVTGPDWFFGVDSGFEFFAFFALMLITLFSWKAFRFTKDKRYRTFATAFAFMALGMACRAVADLFVALNINSRPDVLVGGYVGYIFLTLTSLILFFALMLRATQRAPLVALFIIALVSLFLSQSVRLTFHAISLILLLFISYHFIKNYFQKKSFTALLVCIAFVLLAVAQFQFIVDVLYHKWYILGHLSHVVAFGLLLVALIKVQVVKKR
jgi:hypothetical protein